MVRRVPKAFYGITLLLLVLLAAFSEAQAATVQISNQCNVAVHLWGYSEGRENASALLFDRNVISKNSDTVNTAAGVKTVKIEYQQFYQQTPLGTVTNWRYFDGTKNLRVNLTTGDVGACTIAITEY
ncbi:MAG: hypothetical protein M0009_02910 [Deltaproteobacteria bacterium]|nr:hypothetical protein [Deltaproteobacteria bacterium]